MNLNFVKENDTWYIDLPEWTGDKEELQMISGADTLLDLLGLNPISIEVSLTPVNSSLCLRFIEPHAGGALYEPLSEFYNFTIWLCHVTKFVFGNLPKKIYLKHSNLII